MSTAGIHPWKLLSVLPVSKVVSQCSLKEIKCVCNEGRKRMETNYVSSSVQKEEATPALDVCGLITGVDDGVIGTDLSTWMSNLCL